jgi:hypothetical protein
MVADSFFPLSGPPAVAVSIHGIERIRHGNPFIGELVGGTGMSYLRSPFPSLLVPIEADMDCGAVTTLQDQQIHLPPDRVSAQHWVYGVVLRALSHVGCPSSAVLCRAARRSPPPLLSVSELRYLRKELLPILCKLLYGARCLWRLRCQEVFQPVSGFTFMSCYGHSPRVIHLGIASYLSSQGRADPSPAPGPSPSALSDGASFILVDAAEGIEEADLPFPPAAAELHAAVPFNGDSLV